MPKRVFFKSFTKLGWVCGALLEFKSRPKFDEGIFESYVPSKSSSPCSNQVKDMIEAQKGTIHKSIKFAVYCYIN